jgi:hypothetical protein
MATAPGIAFRVRALPDEFLQRVWSTGHDDMGNAIEISVNEEPGGAPLRCCLREAAVGERVGLIAFRPFDHPGPFAEVGPVFVHPEPCSGYRDVERYPEGFRHRRQVFRAYDAEGRIVYRANRMVDGKDAEAAVCEILADPMVALIHSRNVLAGCYMFAIHRPRPDDGVQREVERLPDAGPAKVSD